MRSINNTDLAGEKVLLRTDINLPIEDGEPRGESLRFERYLETIRELADRDAKLVVMAHQGRPTRDDFTSLEKHAQLIADHVDTNVRFVPGFFGSELPNTLDEIDDGDIAVMENIRFLSEELNNLSPEEHADDIFIQKLAGYFDLYVNDAFSAAHRPHGSLVGFMPHLDTYAGPVMEQEFTNCRKVRDEMDDPVLVLGGEKVSDVINIMDNMNGRCKKILLGGVPGELALHLQGHGIGKKPEWIEQHVDRNDIETMEQMLDEYEQRIEAPVDLVTDTGTYAVGEIPADEMTWDIGEQTCKKYTEEIKNAEGVLFKGPMGAFDRGYEDCSRRMIEAMAESSSFTVISGGHTSSLVKRYGYDIDDFSHVSIAGGAFVQFMSGEKLPVIEALERYS